MCQPEAASIASTCGFNEKSVIDCFDLHEGEINKNKLDGKIIYKMDESGLTSAQKPGKAISQKGKKQLGGLRSAERGSTTTVEDIMYSVEDIMYSDSTEYWTRLPSIHLAAWTYKY